MAKLIYPTSLARSAKMITHFLLIAVLLLLAIRLREVVILLQQRLGRRTNVGSETT